MQGPAVEGAFLCQQFPVEVRAVSSQYGLHCYSAADLLGPSRIFPRYGDSTDAFQPRSYGPWWAAAPSAPVPLRGRYAKLQAAGQRRVQGVDFVEVVYQEAVYITAVTIQET